MSEASVPFQYAEMISMLAKTHAIEGLKTLGIKSFTNQIDNMIGVAFIDLFFK